MPQEAGPANYAELIEVFGKATRPQLLTSEIPSRLAFCSSPDGKYLYYVGEGGADPLMKVLVEGGEETQVLPSVFQGMFGVADEGLRMAGRNDLTIDLMLIDVVMPNLSGPDLGERILGIRPHQKVLFMSGFTDHEVVRVKVLDRGLRFLPKPFTPDGLLQAVQMVLSAPTPISDFKHFVTRAQVG